MNWKLWFTRKLNGAVNTIPGLQSNWNNSNNIWIAWRQKLSFVNVNVHFNSRRTCIWSLSISPIFAEVRLKEFWMLHTAKWLFFNILTFLSVLKVTLVNRCWPNVSQINFTWKITSKGSENIFQSFSYLQYSRSYD